MLLMSGHTFFEVDRIVLLQPDWLALAHAEIADPPLPPDTVLDDVEVRVVLLLLVVVQ